VTIFVEIVLFVIFLYLLYQYRDYWAFIVSIFLLGLVMEVLGVDYVHAYDYHGFLVMPFGVPLAIPAGWALIIFTSVQIVRRSRLPEFLYPFATAFFTVLIDIALDPVMAHAGLWVWKKGLEPTTDFLGIPLYNFWGWFLAGFVVGLSYMFIVNVKKPSWWMYILWGALYPPVWIALMFGLKYVPYLVMYYVLWGLVLFIGIIVRVWGFAKDVVPQDIVMIRWAFYLTSLVVFFWSGLYASKPYIIVPVILSLLIEIFGTSMYDVL